MAVIKDSPTDQNKPGAHKKNQTRRFHAFLLSTNHVHSVVGVRKSKKYELENSEMIKEQASFALKGEMTEWMQQKEMQYKVKEPELSPDPTDSRATNVVAVLDADDQAKVEAALREIDARRPSDKLEVHYRTNGRSKAVSLVFRFRNLQGKEAWNMKPDALCLAFPNFGQVFKQEDKIVELALTNMEHARMRDLAGDMNAAEQKKWKSPTSKEEKSFDCYLCTSYFVLPPLDELTSVAEETEFIRSKCALIGETLLYILKQGTFARCYEHAIKHERIWAAVSGQTSKAPGNSYIDFAKGARVVVMQCPNFNTHVVKDDAARLIEILHNNTYGQDKYPEPEEDSDEETDDEHNDSNNEKPRTTPEPKNLDAAMSDDGNK